MPTAVPLHRERKLEKRGVTKAREQVRDSELRGRRAGESFYRKIYTKFAWGLQALSPREWKAESTVALKSSESG